MLHSGEERVVATQFSAHFSIFKALSRDDAYC